MTEPTDPTTADAAAEHVQAFLDAWDATDYLTEMTEVAGGCHGVPPLDTGDLRTLLADRARVAAELEQVRDDADDYRARRDNAVAQGDASEAEVRELAQALIAAQAKNRRLLDRVLVAEDEARRLRDATLEAAGLLHRLTDDAPCEPDPCGNGACVGHEGFASGYLAPCPYPVGRRFVETWGTQASATDGAQ